MDKDLRAKELALEGALVVFLATALVGVVAGAEQHVAVLRALVAGVVVAFAGRLPVRVLLGALEPPEAEERPDVSREGTSEGPTRR